MSADLAAKIAPSVFAFYMVVGANFLPEIMGCRLQHLLRTSMVAKHIIALLLVFFLVVLANPTATQQGMFVNVGLSVLVYGWFLMTTRSPLGLALLSILLLLAIYLLNAHKAKLEAQKDEAQAQRINSLQTYLAIGAFLVSTVGFLSYALEKKLEYGNKFRVSTFLQGKASCRNYTPVKARVGV